MNKSELDPNLLPLQCSQPANVAILLKLSLLRIYGVMHVFHLLNLSSPSLPRLLRFNHHVVALVQAIQTHAMAF